MPKKPAVKTNNKPAVATARKGAGKPVARAAKATNATNATKAAAKPAKPAPKPATGPASRSATARLAAKPGSTKPGSAKPGSAKPGSAKPGSAKPRPRASVPGSAKPTASRSAAFWPTLAGSLALSGDPQASAASFTMLLHTGNGVAELNQHLAGAMATQFARATGGARRKAARGELSADAIEAAQEVLNALKACAAAAGVIREQSATLAEAWTQLAAPAQRKLQAELGRLVQAVLREPSVADVPALMAAALASALEAAKPVKSKRAKAAQ